MLGGTSGRKTISEILDHIELIREDCLPFKNLWKKMESADPDPPDGDGKRH
jgi:hypothetical protein